MGEEDWYCKLDGCSNSLVLSHGAVAQGYCSYECLGKAAADGTFERIPYREGVRVGLVEENDGLRRDRARMTQRIAELEAEIAHIRKK